MARPLKGGVFEHEVDGQPWWYARVTWNGGRPRIPLAPKTEAFTELQAAAKLELIVQAIKAGTYEGPDAARADDGPDAEPGTDVGAPTLSEYAATWLAEVLAESHGDGGDLRWRLGTWILPRLGEERIDEIDTQTVVAFRAEILQERNALQELIRDPHAVVPRDERGVRVQALGNNSINKIVNTLVRILDDADERGFMQRARPVKVKPLKFKSPRSPVLEQDHSRFLLQAAEQVDHEKAGHTAINLEALRLQTQLGCGYEELAERLGVSLSTAHHRVRRAKLPVLLERLAFLLLTLGLGLRIGEACAVCAEDLDHLRRRLAIPDAKTAAGIRMVQMSPRISAGLERFQLVRQATGRQPLLVTSKGLRYDRTHAARKLLHPTLDRTDELLRAAGLTPLYDGVTSKSLRKSYITYLYEIGAPPRFAADQVGHIDPSTGLRIYTESLRDRDRSKVLEDFDRFTDAGEVDEQA